jgi:cell division septum initiation protein DivIVA
MQPDSDTQLSNSSGETPQPDFARVLRGYDSRQVKKYLEQIDGELQQERAQLQALRRELADVHRQIQEQERPAHSGPGPRAGRRCTDPA